MKNKLLENIAALLVVQGSQYLLPLLTYPYLIRVLGTEAFGILGYAHTLSFYGIVLADFGFSLTATRLIALHHRDPDALGGVISPILVIKGILLLLGLGLTLTFTEVVPSFQPFRWVFLGSFLRVVGEGLFPVWYFQGLERMKVITALQVIAKTSTVISVFMFVKTPADLTLAAFLNSSGSVLMGGVGLTLMIRDPRWHWQKISIQNLKELLGQSFPVTLALFAYTALTNTHIFVLGLFADLQTLGSLIVAERIIRALSLIVVPLGSALYPHVSRLFQEGKTLALTFLRRCAPWGASFFVLISLGTGIGADHLVTLIGGSPNPASGHFLRIMCGLPLMTYGVTVYANGILLAGGHNTLYSRCYVGAGALVVVLSLLCVPIWGGNATAILMPVGDGILLAAMIWASYQVGVTPWLTDVSQVRQLPPKPPKKPNLPHGDPG